MLAGDRSPGGDAYLHDLLHRMVDMLRLLGIARVVGKVGMQVAVAGVEHVAHLHAVLAPDARDLGEDLRQPRARNDRILNDEMERQPAHRAERLLPSLPEARTIGRIGRGAYGARAGFGAEAGDAFRILTEPRCRA